MPSDLTTAEGLRQANEELAKLCGLTREIIEGEVGTFMGGDWQAGWPPNFFAGLRADGTCDERKVDGALLGRLIIAVKDRLWLWWDGAAWVGEATDGTEERTHAHPIVALYRCLKATWLLKGEADAE